LSSRMGSSQAQVIWAVGLYSAASSLMLVVNKLALSYIPLHSTVTVAQLLFCAIAVFGMKFSGMIDVDGFEAAKVKPYILYIIVFCLGIYTNARALAVSNVETVIVFRACAPIVVAGLDYVYLGRDLPNKKSTVALLAILVGAAGYVLSDAQFAADGLYAYSWVFAYFVTMCFQMSYGKWCISAVKMTNPVWGAVLYTNTLGILPELFLGFGLFGEGAHVSEVTWTSAGLSVLLLSCINGTVISYAGFNCRNVLSATSFTVVGVMNKMVTVLINCLIWDNHATAVGILWLGVCIGGGTMYREAPLRQNKQQEETGTDIEKGALTSK